jgi:hypothetical protein
MDRLTRQRRRDINIALAPLDVPVAVDELDMDASPVAAGQKMT